MSKYTVRYGRVVNVSGYESARIELEEEFDSAQLPDRKDAIIILAHERSLGNIGPLSGSVSKLY